MSIGLNVHANGIRQHLIHHPGPGPQLLLIPGITSPAITWAFVAERLAAHLDVYTLDVRGRGLSEGGALDYSLAAMAADAVAVAEVLGLRDWVLLGHSMGARTAIRAGRQQPKGLRQLVLVDPPVSGPGRRAYPSALPWYVDSIALAQKGCSAEDMRAFCPTWTEEQRALRAEWLHTCEPAAVRAAYDGFHTDDIHVDLPHLTVPTRLVVAGGAPVIGPDDVAEIRSLLPTVEVRTVAGAGHMIPWDDLDGFLAAITDLGHI
ncbi:alpha/beta fold hydrolase [Segnochrobactraceae bacterium EtOH-i3]